MSSSITFRSLVLACAAGTLALTAHPASSQAQVAGSPVLANPLRTTPATVPIDPANVTYFQVVGDGVNATVNRTWDSISEGDMVVANTDAELQTCRSNYNAHGPNDLQTWLPNSGCLYIKRFTNQPSPGTVYDVPATAPAAQLANVPGLTPDWTDFVMANGKAVHQPSLVLQPTDKIHTYLVVNPLRPTEQVFSVPALPPYAVVGLWMIFASAGAFVTFRLRRQTRCA